MVSKDNIIIHGLWIGEYLSPLEQLTIHSFLKQGHAFHLWVYDAIKTPLPAGVIIRNAEEVLPRSSIFRYRHNNQFGHGKNSLAGFSDLFRYKLLYDHGGWWVDMDVTCFKALDFEAPYVFRTHQKLNTVGNIMKCPKGSQLMKDCFDMANQRVNAENRDWMLPINILNENIEKLGLSHYIQTISNDDSWYVIRNFFRSEYPIPANWHAIHWNNEDISLKGIDKYANVSHSLFGNLMAEYKLESKRLTGFDALAYRFRLTRVYSLLNYLYKKYL